LRLTAALLGLFVSGISGLLAQQQPAGPDLSASSLEDLTQMQLRVTSFARKDQDLWTTPAAVFVITKEDIERSAATSIPELLRMVPGVQVAQIDASTWAVSVRGFNSVYASKVLVLIDGRTIYSEIYSGEHWDQNDLPLENIERIEVIRGPGAAVWGTNAVNGVINIITKRARSTVGYGASGQYGRVEDMAHVQWGGSIGDRVQYHSYLFFTDRQPFYTSIGQQAYDGERSLRGGGRIDWQRSVADWITLSGDLYGGRLKQQIQANFALPLGPNHQDSGSIGGGYVLSRWEHKLPHSDTALQFYYDDTSRHELSSAARTRTLDAEYQNHRAAGPRNDMVWGGGFRFTSDHIGGQTLLTMKPEYKNYLVDGFIQDEFTLVPHRLVFTFGSKIQQGTLAGFQLQPSGRLLWSPNEKQSMWGAVSRAAVAPAIQDTGLNVPLNFGTQMGLPVTGFLQGNPNSKPEIAVVYEVGYRRKVTNNLTLDVAAFFNVYDRLQSVEPQTPVFVPTPTPHVQSNLLYENGFSAKTTGTEVALSWKPVPSLSLQANYSWMQAQVKEVDPADDDSLVDTWSTPRNSASGSISWSFVPGWSLNTFASFTDTLPTVSTSNQVPRYTRLDMHISRKIGHAIEVDAGGTNLLTPRHVEFSGDTAALVPSYVPRSFFVKAKWTF
jgi:iron complex outermembrane receptor protein